VEDVRADILAMTLSRTTSRIESRELIAQARDIIDSSA